MEMVNLPTTVHIIRVIDEEAMKADFFATLNGGRPHYRQRNRNDEGLKRKRITMKYQNLFIRQKYAVLLACGVIAGLLPGFAAAQDQSQEPPLKVLFDTDGKPNGDIDDAFALIYLLNSPEIDLRGVTTRQKESDRVANYMREIIDVMGRGGEIPVYAGATRNCAMHRE